MTGRTMARTWSVRDLPRATWLLLALAGVYLVWAFVSPAFRVTAALAAAGPILFAAAVLAVNPADRRFAWAALALAAGPTLRMVGVATPQLWQMIAPGDWVNAVPALIELGGGLSWLGNVVQLVGVWLLGYALGGVRSPIGLAITGLGVLIALANLAWLVTHMPQGIPPLELAQGIAFATFSSLGWAFLLSAAVESLRSLMVVGAALLFGSQVINGVLLWWPLGPATNFDLLGLVLSGIVLAGWLSLIAGVVRGELDTAPAAVRTRR